MEVVFSYYEIFTIILSLVWVFLFVFEPRLRREMLILSAISLLVLPLAFTAEGVPLDEAANAMSRLHLADLLFSWSVAGIAATIFHAAFGKEYHPLPKIKRKRPEDEDVRAQIWLMRLIVSFLFFIWGVVLLVFLFQITLSAAVFLSAVVLTTYLVSHRHDLLLDAVWSGLLTALVVFSASTIATVFGSVDLSAAPIHSAQTFFGVPVDLLLWSLALGIGLGPLYEYMRRFELT